MKIELLSLAWDLLILLEFGYDVDKIIASNTLLSGELVRKNKDAIGGSNDPPLIQNSSRELDLIEDNSSSGSDWKMVLYQSPQHNVVYSSQCCNKN